MKRVLIVMALLAATAVGAAVIYQAAARERNYRMLLARGDAALAEEQTFAAIEDYSGAIALRPDSMLAHLRRGETYRQRGDLDAAARDFRTAASLDPSATRPLEQWGDVLYEQQRYRRAADAYENRLLLDDRSAGVRYRLGMARYREGNLDAAVTALRQAVILDPQLIDAYYVLGLVLRDQWQWPEAAEAFEKAIQHAPGLIPAREELADVKDLLGRRDEGIQQLQVLAGLEPGRMERRIAVALANARAGHGELAVLTLASALDQASDPSLVYGALGRVWLDISEGQHERPDALAKALEALERAASTGSATSEVKTLYGRALLLDQQPEAAERVLQQATERFPVDPRAFAEYAEVAEQQNHFDAARTALLTYSALASDDGDSARALKIGELSLVLLDTPTAVVWLERAAAARPGDVRAWEGLAQARFQAGNYDAARDALARGLQLDPSSEPLRALARRLT